MQDEGYTMNDARCRIHDAEFLRSVRLVPNVLCLNTILDITVWLDKTQNDKTLKTFVRS